MHFLPWQVTGRNDESTAAAVFALIEKYFPDNLDALNQRHAFESLETNYKVVRRQGQVDQWFSDGDLKKSTSFFSYANSGKFRLLATEQMNADIYVNGQKLNIDLPIAQELTEYSLAKRTKNGVKYI